MKVIQSQPKSRSSRVQPVAAALPVQHHRGRMIAVIVFAVVLLVAIVLFIVYGTQIAGKAVAFAPEKLNAGEGGIPVRAGTTMTVDDTQDFIVYAHLGASDGYGFHFEMQYNPSIIEIVTSSIVPVLSGVTLLDPSIKMVGKTNSFEVQGMSTQLESGKPLQGLKRLNKNNPLVPLVKFKVKAKKAGSSGVSFTVFEVFDKTTNANLVKVKLPPKGFEVVAKAVVPTCSSSNLELCKDAQGCVNVKGYWSKSNSVCVANCPVGTAANQFGVCQTSTPTCSSTNLAACSDATACGTSANGKWYNGACVASCPVGTSADQFGICQTSASAGSTCSASNLGACSDATACGTSANGKWYNDACVASCPVGTSADQFGVCQMSCSSSNLGACSTSSACKNVLGYWSNNACVATCPTGTESDDLNVCVEKAPVTCSSSNLGACTTAPLCKSALSYWSNNACVASCPTGTKSDDLNVCIATPAVCPSADWTNVCCELTDIQFKDFMNAQLKLETPYTDIQFKNFMNAQLKLEPLCTK